MTATETSMRRILRALAALPADQVKQEQRELAIERERLEARQQQLTLDLVQVQRELADLELEDRVLGSVVASMHLVREADGDAQETDAPRGAEAMSKASRAPSQESADATDRPSIPRSEAVLQIVIDHGIEGMTPSDVRAKLVQLGDTEADTNGVRVALRRWVKRGRLAKVGRVYKAPEQHHAADETDENLPDLLSSTATAT